MADAGVSAARILLIMMTGGLVIGSRLEVLRSREIVHVMLVLLGSGMAFIADRLHANRNSQHIAAEQRQPNGYEYRNRFSNGT